MERVGRTLYCQAARPNLSATPLSTTSDRPGRTMRIGAGATTSLTDPAQKKQWIDLVGPMAVMITPPATFGALGSGIYKHVTTDPLGMAHALLVVGFDDTNRYWIVKNSWGPGWGDQGFGLVSYDALDPQGQIVQAQGYWRLLRSSACAAPIQTHGLSVACATAS